MGSKALHIKAFSLHKGGKVAQFNTINEAIEDFKAEKPVIVADDEDRENEGDLILAADFVTPEWINFMITHCRGLVCHAITPEIASRLGITPMVENNTDIKGTNFTQSVDADPKFGTTTGISAYDRAKTVQVIINKTSVPSDLRRPGHIFPLIAKQGGVLKRAGHTETADYPAVVPHVQFMTSGLAYALADDRLAFYEGAQKPVSKFEMLLADEVRSVYNNEEYVALVTYDTTGSNKYRVDVYDSNGEKHLSKGFDLEYRNVVLKDENVYIYGETECCIYNLSGVEKFGGAMRESISLLIPGDSVDKFTLVGPESINTVELK